MPFKIIRNDITQMKVDAIVNAANTDLAPGRGVCGAIFRAAGYDALAAECAKLGHCDTGRAVCTKGYKLPAKYIIHTPGPIYFDGKHGEEELLRSCYKSCLELAKAKKAGSIAFPLISSGIYGYPKAEALKVATNAIMDFLAENEMEIYLVVYDKSAFEISSKLFADVEEFIRHVEIDEGRRLTKREAAEAYSMSMDAALPTAGSIDEMLRHMDTSFSEYLLTLIDKSGKTDAQVYKKANIDRKLFSKIRSNPHYKPSKPTAAAFALALELDLDGTRDLIGRAGYALSRSSKFDIIIEYFITNKSYDIIEINEVLFAFDQPLIGA